jgi:hypothetical protein
MIFGICLVETCVVDAHSKLHVGLRDGHRIGQLPGVVDLPYEASVKQLFYFFTNEVLSLNRQLPGPLLDRSGIRVDLQMVLNHLPRDPRHLRRMPGKHIDISPEEGDEHEFPFAVQITRDTGSLSSLSPDLDGLHRDVFLARGLHTRR